MSTPPNTPQLSSFTFHSCRSPVLSSEQRAGSETWSRQTKVKSSMATECSAKYCKVATVQWILKLWLRSSFIVFSVWRKFSKMRFLRKPLRNELWKNCSIKVQKVWFYPFLAEMWTNYIVLSPSSWQNSFNFSIVSVVFLVLFPILYFVNVKQRAFVFSKLKNSFLMWFY